MDSGVAAAAFAGASSAQGHRPFVVGNLLGPSRQLVGHDPKQENEVSVQVRDLTYAPRSELEDVLFVRRTKKFELFRC